MTFQIVTEEPASRFKIVEPENTAPSRFKLVSGGTPTKETSLLKESIDVVKTKSLSAASEFYDAWKEGVAGLQSPTQPPKSVKDFIGRVVPESGNKLVFGLATFPYFLAKSFTDPAIEGFSQIPEKGIKQANIDVLKKEGAALYENVEGLGRFMGEQIGVFGWKAFKHRWATDPAGAIFGLLPFFKGIMEYAKPRGMKPAEAMKEITEKSEQTGKPISELINIEKVTPEEAVKIVQKITKKEPAGATIESMGERFKVVEKPPKTIEEIVKAEKEQKGTRLIAERDRIKVQAEKELKEIQEAEVKTEFVDLREPKTTKFNPEKDNLSEWVKKKGGINFNKEHLKGELRYIQEQGQGKFLVNKKGEGLTLDYMVEAAKEDGFLREGDGIREFLDKLDNDLTATTTGSRIYSIYKEDYFPDIVRTKRVIDKTQASEPVTQPFAEGVSVKLPKSPQDYTITKVIKSTKDEIAMGEQYFEIKNNRTGVIETVEQADIRPIKRSKHKGMLADEAGFIDIKREPNPSGVKAMELVRRRVIDIDKTTLDSEAFISPIETGFTKLEREAIPFIIEGVKNPDILKKIGREDLIEVLKKPPEKLKQLAEKIGDYFDEGYGFLQEHGEKISYVENYVNRVWEVPKAKKSMVVNYFATKNPFTKKRIIGTREQGIEMGLILKELDIANLLRMYDQYKIKTVFNKRFAESLKNLKDGDGNPLMMRFDKAPADWVTVEHPALSRAMVTGKVTKIIKSPTTIIKESIERIITIEKSGATSKTNVAKTINKLEEVVASALESRGMTKNEASVYLDKLKTAYAGKEFTGQKISEIVKKADPVFKEIELKYPVDVPILSKVPVKVHPDIAPEVNLVLGSRFTGAGIAAWETINAFAKKGQLTLSGFHPMALYEAAFSTGIGIKALKLFNPESVYRALRYKDFEVFKRQELAKDSIEHNVKYGALPDVQIAKVKQALEAIERKTKNIPAVKRLTSGIRTANDLWDRGLWDYVHNTFKLLAYEENVFRALKDGNKYTQRKFKRNLTEKEVNAIKDEMGLLTNDTFGGQRWEIQRVLGQPKTQQALHWALLAPDWTLSVLKQAAAPVRGALKQVTARFEPTVEGRITKALVGKTLTKRGALFWAKAIIYFNLVAQSVNMIQTKRHLGQAKPTWENDPGHELNIFWGFNEDGTKRYIRMGKQFREVMEWFLEPEIKVGSKMSPTLREAMRQTTRHDPGSGYPTKFESMDFYESIPERLKSIAKIPIPFSLRPYIEDRPRMFMFSLPTSKGMTNYKTVQLFKKEMKALVDKTRELQKRKVPQKQINASVKKHKRESLRIYISALENRLDAESLFSSAKSFIKAEFTLDDKKIAEEIYKEFRLLKGREIIDALKLYKRKGVLTPKIEEELKKLDKKQGTIATQQRRLPQLYREYEELK